MFKHKDVVLNKLKERNMKLANFWFLDSADRYYPDADLLRRKVLIIDAEDSFTRMIAQQLKSIGLDIIIKPFYINGLLDDNWDLIVMGPGLGDPSNLADHRIAIMHRFINTLLKKQLPFLAICLSHQILCLTLGLLLIRCVPSNQGVQREINFFGKKELVGFYNTYVAQCCSNHIIDMENNIVSVSKNSYTNEVYGLQGKFFTSMQFHPESLLSRNGINIISSSIKRIIHQ